MTELKVWKTIKLGTDIKTTEDFCVAIEAAGGEVDDDAKYVMSQLTFAASDSPIELDLVAITAVELGFVDYDNGTRQQIYDKAQSIGLLLCPAEVGPQLRLQHMDQSNKEEWLVIGMEPAPNSYGGLSPLLVCYDEDNIRRLSTLPGNDFTWGGLGNNINTRWIFVLPRKS